MSNVRNRQPYAKDKEVRRLIRFAIKLGWTVEVTGSGHLKWKPPDGSPFVVSSRTPSDPRALQNLRAYLRRAGLPL